MNLNLKVWGSSLAEVVSNHDNTDVNLPMIIDIDADVKACRALVSTTLMKYNSTVFEGLCPNRLYLISVKPNVYGSGSAVRELDEDVKLCKDYDICSGDDLLVEILPEGQCRMGMIHMEDETNPITSVQSKLLADLRSKHRNVLIYFNDPFSISRDLSAAEFPFHLIVSLDSKLVNVKEAIACYLRERLSPSDPLPGEFVFHVRRRFNFYYLHIFLLTYINDLIMIKIDSLSPLLTALT